VVPHDIQRKKKLKSVPSAGETMATVFWDEKGVVLVAFLPRQTTVGQYSVIYTETL
jgi:hypothetical protein